MNSKHFRAFVSLAAAGSFALVPFALLASETDDRIEASAKASYVFKTFLKDDSIKTESKNGVVVLTGTVGEEFHRSLAQDTIEGLPGVKSVDNRLKTRTEAPAEHSDAWLVTKVKTSLLFHRNVSATGTEVRATNGVVHLHGETANLAQKELTAEYARDVDGVKEVRNDLTVVSAIVAVGDSMKETVDDASITAQFKAALLSHRSTSAVKTQVRTVDGVVTVGGPAKNAAERSLVTKLANDIRGVVSVVNDMTVAAH